MMMKKKQNETRAFEKQVLEADDLRLHPRDPKNYIDG